MSNDQKYVFLSQTQRKLTICFEQVSVLLLRPVGRPTLQTVKSTRATFSTDWVVCVSRFNMVRQGGGGGGKGDDNDE